MGNQRKNNRRPVPDYLISSDEDEEPTEIAGGIAADGRAADTAVTNENPANGAAVSTENNTAEISATYAAVTAESSVNETVKTDTDECSTSGEVKTVKTNTGEIPASDNAIVTADIPASGAAENDTAEIPSAESDGAAADTAKIAAIVAADTAELISVARNIQFPRIATVTEINDETVSLPPRPTTPKDEIESFFATRVDSAWRRTDSGNYERTGVRVIKTPPYFTGNLGMSALDDPIWVDEPDMREASIFLDWQDRERAIIGNEMQECI